MLVMACLQLLVESLNFNTFMSVIISFFMSSVNYVGMEFYIRRFYNWAGANFVCVCKTTVFHTILSVMLLLKSVYTSS